MNLKHTTGQPHTCKHQTHQLQPDVPQLIMQTSKNFYLTNKLYTLLTSLLNENIKQNFPLQFIINYAFNKHTTVKNVIKMASTYGFTVTGIHHTRSSKHSVKCRP